MIYTVNIGAYRPERKDIKCYTEDKLGNPHYSSRLYKTLSHIYDPGEWSVYVDSDIFLPEGLEQKLIQEVEESGKLIGVFRNPWRDCVYEEAEEVKRLKKDTPENIEKTLKMFESKGVKPHSGLSACGVLVRKNHTLTNMMNSKWWEMICAYSKRDQLTFPIVYSGYIHWFEGDIYKYKSWER